MRKPLQLPLTLRTHGGRRRGAGRPAGPRPNVRHRARPELFSRHPVHVTLRLRRELGSLRRRNTYSALWKAWSQVSSELGLRLVHYSVQFDHIHLIVEIASKMGLSRGMQGLMIRMARALNRVLGRRGAVFSDRYHARALGTPREIKNALVYVLNNRLHHTRVPTRRAVFDPYSSAVWFEGWREGLQSWPKAEARPPPVVAPSTWLLAQSWKRHPAPSLTDVPGSARARPDRAPGSARQRRRPVRATASRSGSPARSSGRSP
jgi:REP element-mobilizing transposase RayT